MLEMHWIPDARGRLTIVWKPATSDEITEVAVVRSQPAVRQAPPARVAAAPVPMQESPRAA